MIDINDVYVGIEWEPQLTLLNYGKKPVSVHYQSYANKTKNGVDLINIDHTIALFISDDFIFEFFSDKMGWRGMSIFDKSRLLSIDGSASNLEIRTNVVKLKDLYNEIELSTFILGRFIEKLAKEVGPVGVFLPALFDGVGISEEEFAWSSAGMLSKHLNVSVNKYWVGSKWYPGYIIVYNNKLYSENMIYRNDSDDFSKVVYHKKSYSDSPILISNKLARSHFKLPYVFADYERFIRRYVISSDYGPFEYVIDESSLKPFFVGYCYKDKFVRVGGLV